MLKLSSKLLYLLRLLYVRLCQVRNILPNCYASYGLGEGEHEQQR
jgi:hypothetical protein